MSLDIYQIKIVTVDPKDISIQRDYLDIEESLRDYSPSFMEIGASSTVDGRPKSGVDVSIGAIHVAIPAGAAAAVLITWIKSYFHSRSARKVEITSPDGATISLTGFDPNEIANLFPLPTGALSEAKPTELGDGER